MKKLIKVIFEYEDEIRVLEGNDAQKWIDTINGQCVFNFVHGIKFPKFNWKVSKKRPYKLRLNLINE